MAQSATSSDAMQQSPTETQSTIPIRPRHGMAAASKTPIDPSTQSDNEYNFTGKYLFPYLTPDLFTTPAKRNIIPWQFNKRPRIPISPRITGSIHHSSSNTAPRFVELFMSLAREIREMIYEFAILNCDEELSLENARTINRTGNRSVPLCLVPRSFPVEYSASAPRLAFKSIGSPLNAASLLPPRSPEDDAVLLDGSPEVEHKLQKPASWTNRNVQVFMAKRGLFDYYDRDLSGQLAYRNILYFVYCLAKVEGRVFNEEGRWDSTKVDRGALQDFLQFFWSKSVLDLNGVWKGQKKQKQAKYWLPCFWQSPKAFSRAEHLTLDFKPEYSDNIQPQSSQNWTLASETTRNQNFISFCNKLAKYFPSARTLTVFLMLDVQHAQDTVYNPGSYPWIAALRKTGVKVGFDVQLHLAFRCCHNIVIGETVEGGKVVDGEIQEALQTRFQGLLGELMLPKSLYKGEKDEDRNKMVDPGIRQWCCMKMRVREKGYLKKF